MIIMKIIKTNNSIKIIEDDFSEEYSFDKEITFEKLTAYLIGKNLSSRINIEDESKDNSDNEQSLVVLIKEIINKYNDEFDEYQKFLKELKK